MGFSFVAPGSVLAIEAAARVDGIIGAVWSIISKCRKVWGEKGSLIVEEHSLDVGPQLQHSVRGLEWQLPSAIAVVQGLYFMQRVYRVTTTRSIRLTLQHWIGGDVDSQPLTGLSDFIYESIVSCTWFSSIASSQIRRTGQVHSLITCQLLQASRFSLPPLANYEHFD